MINHGQETAHQVEQIPSQCNPYPLDELVSLDGDYLVLVADRSSYRVKTIREGENLKLREEECVIDKLDLRNIPEKEIRRAVSKFRRPMLLDVEQESCNWYTDKQRAEMAERVVRIVGKMSHVLKAYLVGSVVCDEDNPNSDVDILVVRHQCPGYDSCAATFRSESLVDIFCFTEDELRRAHEKKLAILLGVREIYNRLQTGQRI